jgi:FKBP-type peptidyl-prolyl cis-trans isomerase
LVVAGLLPAAALAQGGAEMTPEAKQKEERSKMFYALGFSLGNNVKRSLIIEDEEDYKFLSQGMRDSLTDRKAQVDVDAQKPAVIQYYRESAKKISEKKLAEQKKFWDAAKKERRTKELDDKILVQTISEGKGAKPKASDRVKVHYKGALIDGTPFDSSIARGEPITFPLNGVIACWTKGVQEMKVGGKAKLVCPPDTAYGTRDMGTIPPNSMLVFEVELIEINPQ